MNRDKSTVIDILNACEQIHVFIDQMTYLEFSGDLKTQSAVLHQLLIIGEASRRLSEHFRERHAQIPWRQIIGMRNRLIHGYDVVDLKEVWNTISNHLIELKNNLEPLCS